MWGPRCIEDLKCEGKAVGLDGNGICRGKSQTLGQVCNEIYFLIILHLYNFAIHTFFQTFNRKK